MRRTSTISGRCQTLVATMALMAAIACTSSVRVDTDYDPSYDFGALGTYAWMPDPPAPSSDPQLRNSLLDGRVRRAVDARFAAKGIRKVEPGAAQFLINYYVNLDQKIRVDNIPTSNYGYGYDAWYGGYGGYGMSTETRVSQYEEGTLILDLADPKSSQLIWRGTGATRIAENETPEQRDQKVDEVVTKILEQFPPKQK